MDFILEVYVFISYTHTRVCVCVLKTRELKNKLNYLYINYMMEKSLLTHLSSSQTHLIKDMKKIISLSSQIACFLLLKEKNKNITSYPQPY